MELKKTFLETHEQSSTGCVFLNKYFFKIQHSLSHGIFFKDFFCKDPLVTKRVVFF